MQRVAVVTGANKGIGLAIVKNLAPRFDGVVYLTARNEERGKKAVSDLNSQGLKNVKYHQLDVTDKSSIEKLTRHIGDNHKGLDVLINNAGIYVKEKISFGESAKKSVGVNFFGTLNVSESLFPLLRPHSRVVHLGTILALLNHIKNDSLKEKLSSEKATVKDVVEVMNLFVESAQNGSFKSLGFPNLDYHVSKIGVMALTRVQQRMFDQDPKKDILVNCAHPGLIKTDMNPQGVQTPDQGSRTPIDLALITPNTGVPKGQLWFSKKPFDWFAKVK